MDNLSREIIIDRYKNPHHRGEIHDHDITFEDDNPLCGDHIQVDLKVDQNDIITDAAFSGKGCSISQASADLLMEDIIGKSIDQVKALTKEDVLDLIGIELGPVRLKCALLSLKVVKAGVYGINHGEASDDLIA